MEDRFGPLDGDALPVDILDRYCAGRLSPAEADALDAWFVEHPEWRKKLPVLREALTQAVPAAVAPDVVRAMAQRMLAADDRGAARHSIDRPHTKSRIAIPAPRMRSTWQRWGIVGAGAVAAILIAALSPTFRTLVRRSSASVAPRHYAVGRAQSATIQLTDGSTVVLAPETRLTYTTDAHGARIVTLDGEAFFTVVPHAGRPFLVRTGRATTRVLGTAFDVRHYPTDRETHVAVTTGKVVVAGATAAHPSVTLVAGTVGVVTDSTAILTSTDSASRYTAWTSGMLVFHNVATTEILAALSRWYGYEFRVADSAITAQSVTATFSTRSSSEALDNLKILLNVELTIDGDVVTLRAGHSDRLPVRERSRRDILNPKMPEVGR